VIELHDPAAAGSTAPRPALLAWGRVWYRDARKGIEHSAPVSLVVELPGEGVAPPSWESAEPAVLPVDRLASGAPAAASTLALPPGATRAASWKSWRAAFKRHLEQGMPLTLWRHAASGLVSRPGEGERELRIRVAEAQREERGRHVDQVRARWEKKLATATARVERAARTLAEQEGQLASQRTQAAISVGATVLGAIFGRRAVRSSLGRATTAARGFGRTQREAQDVEHARQALAEAREQLAEVERQSAADLAGVAAAAASDATLEPLRLLPREVEVGGLALLWRR
jgi:hypothetical protein